MRALIVSVATGIALLLAGSFAAAASSTWNFDVGGGRRLRYQIK